MACGACLLGAPVRYDGRAKTSHHPVLERWLAQGRVISVCPEMLGGLGTPRPPAEIENDGTRRVRTDDGTDVTAAFVRGAEAVGDAARANSAVVAVLKSGSPSCGTSFVYDGTFTKTRVAGEGITTELLRKRGITVFSEDELEVAQRHVEALEARTTMQ